MLFMHSGTLFTFNVDMSFFSFLSEMCTSKTLCLLSQLIMNCNVKAELPGDASGSTVLITVCIFDLT